MSGRAGLMLRRIELRRLPGIADGFSLENLSDGINLVYGPNASGKTTTARTIQALLWPEDAPPRAAFAGWLCLEESEWFVEVDAGRVVRQQDGIERAGLPVPPSVARDRYCLTLHDLLSADDLDFAQAIVRESAGGYDLAGAGRELGYRLDSPRGSRQSGALQQARAEVSVVRQAQAALREQEQRLGELRLGLEEAEQAVAELRRLEIAQELAERRRQRSELQVRLGQFPEGVARLRGDEAERRQELREQLEALAERQAQTEQRIARARADLAASGLSEQPLPAGLVASLRQQIQQLQTEQSRVESARQALSRANAGRGAARASVAASISDEQLASLQVDGIRELAGLVRDGRKLAAERQAVAALQSWVGPLDASEDLDRLRDGVRCLNRRLRVATSPVRPVRPAFVWPLVGIALLEALALAVLVHPLFLALALVALGVGLPLGRLGPAAGNAATSAAELEREFAALGLGLPVRWETGEIERLAEDLLIRLRDGVLLREKRQRWADLGWRRADLERDEALFVERRDQLAARYGVVVDEPAALDLLASAVDRWQAASRELDETAAALRESLRRRDELRDGLNEQLGHLGYPAAEEPAALLGYLEDLDGRERQFNKARDEIASAGRSIDQDIAPQIERYRRRAGELMARLGLGPDDDAALSGWLDRHDQYRELVEALGALDAQIGEREARLHDRPELTEADQAEIELRLVQAREHAARRDELQGEIATIQARIADAKQATRLEQALAAEQREVETLRETRERDYGLVAGWVLTDFVRERTRDRDRPPVFHRARELFSRITQGRYRLELSDDGPAAFRAVDMTTGTGQALDELSSASRLQLLMAVRLAFVEQAEQGPKLPLLLDETLGNSDEQRARAIIDAAIAICREGRQVFYFTAQYDEVGKWLGILGAASDVPHIVVNLTEARQLADLDRLVPLDIVEVPRPAIPTPEGMSRQEYGAALRVPGIDPRSAIGSLHLWHVVPDLEQLHRLVSYGIVTWGQLDLLLQQGSSRLLDDAAALEQVRGRVRLIERAVELWRVGRGRPVDRVALLESGAVSEGFIDRVSELARRVGGDAADLIDALLNGEISRFRQANIDRLREHLIERGYLSERAPLSYDEIRIQLLGLADRDLREGGVTIAEIDEILQTIVAAVARTTIAAS